MTARVDVIMTAIANGGTVNFAPHSRMEEYLMRCLEGGGTEGLPKPISRVDAQLYEIIENGGMGTGGTYVPEEDVATNEEVEQVITEVFSDNSGEEAVSTDEEVFDNSVVN